MSADASAALSSRHARRQGRKAGRTGQTYQLVADVVFKAIGQKVLWDASPIRARSSNCVHKRIAIDDERRTSLAGVWAGGDCVHGGEDLTVSAVQDGKVAALSIDKFLKGGA